MAICRGVGEAGVYKEDVGVSTSFGGDVFGTGAGVAGLGSMEHPVMNAIIAMIAAVRERICVAFIGGLLRSLAGCSLG